MECRSSPLNSSSMHGHEPRSLRSIGPQLFSRIHLRRAAVIAAAALAFSCSSQASGPAPDTSTPLAAATSAVLSGSADSAIAELRSILLSNPDPATAGQAHLLLCRAFYSESLASAAAAECTAALRTLANDSSAQDWAGRAYGMQANGAGPIAGLRLALKVRSAFETAVRLDPANGAAVNDLSEYYIDAPSIVGGGLDKAASLADRSAAQLPQNAHRTRAM